MALSRLSRVSIALSALIALASSTPVGAQTTGNPFGVMLAGSTSDHVAVASDLGARYVRRLVSVATWNGRCGGCGAYSAAGFGIVLTVRNNGTHDVPTTPPASLAVYRSRLEEIVDSVRPALLVVENEEQSRRYYTGTADEYEEQLRVACEVAHSRGIQCTNGGVPNPLAIQMTYIRFLDQGKRQEADSYARRVTLTDAEYRRLTDRARRDEVRGLAEYGYGFVDRYRSAGADFINFHWYRADAKGFAQTVNLFRSRTGLPVVSNELGQYNDSRSQIEGIMGVVVRKEMPYAIWFSIDLYVEAQDRETRALHNGDFSLRPHGDAYRDFVASRF